MRAQTVTPDPTFVRAVKNITDKGGTITFDLMIQGRTFAEWKDQAKKAKENGLLLEIQEYQELQEAEQAVTRLANLEFKSLQAKVTKRLVALSEHISQLIKEGKLTQPEWCTTATD